MAIHIQPNPATSVAERVLLPGDPQRALAVAQALLESPLMLNAARGLWGYTGRAADGGLVTVQSTGMGGPSAAIVTEELIALGARTLIRIGTCGALGDGLELGQVLAASAVISFDGTSRALGADGRVEPDAELTAALEAAGAQPAAVVSTDLFYDPRDDLEAQWRDAGAEVVEMEAATVLTVAQRHGVPAACLLGVTDLLDGGRTRLEREAVDELGVELGATALQALATTR